MTMVDMDLALVGGVRDALASAAAALGPGGVGEQAQAYANILNEAMGIAESGARPDFEALLYESLGAVALASGRHFLPTADRHGVDAAEAVLGDMAPALGSLAEGKDWLPQLCEAVRVQPPVYVLELGHCPQGRWLPLGRTGPHVCAAVPRKGESLVLDDGSRARVWEVEHEGAAVVILAQTRLRYGGGDS